MSSEPAQASHAPATPPAPQPAAPPVVRVHAARREGRGHRRRGEPCQDAHATWTDGVRAVAAVADGLGSQPLSRHGSQAAADAAVASLAGEPTWDEDALRRSFVAARAAIQVEAERLGVPLAALATTLQVAVRDGPAVLAGMVGDGAVVAGAEPVALLAPAMGGYANEVVPLTADDWEPHLRVARLEAAGPVLVFTDGLTRLLLARDGDAWTPFAPFFSRFLPALAADIDGALVRRFVAGDDVDRSWDDDKCLAVIQPC